MYQSNPRTPIPSDILRAFDERLAPYGGEFETQPSPVGHLIVIDKMLAKATRLRKRQQQKQLTSRDVSLSLWQKKNIKRGFAVIIVFS